MNILAAELLKEIRQGDYIIVQYGSSFNQMAAVGTVEKWTENLLYMRQDDGRRALINLDDLRSIIPSDQVEREAAGDTLQPQKHRSLSAQEKEYQMLRRLEPLSPAVPRKYSFDGVIASIRNLLRNGGTADSRKVFGAILDSMQHSVRNRELKFKYHNLKAKILATWPKCESEEDFKVFYLALGILAVEAKEYEFAIEPFLRAHDYFDASYAAFSAELTESARVFTICTALQNEHEALDEFVSKAIVSYRDPQTLRKLLERNQRDDEKCEPIATCAFALFQAAKGSLSRDITPFDSAYTAAATLLDAIPEGWAEKKSADAYYEEWESFRYPVFDDGSSETQTGRLSGPITIFNEAQKWGFISARHYFYVSQIPSDTEEGITLRQLLAAGAGNGIDVTYRLGESNIRPGKQAATEVELTAAGLQEAKRRLFSVTAAPTGDPYQNHPFEPLEVWEPEVRRAADRPLLWGGKTPVSERSRTAAGEGDFRQTLPVKPADQNRTRELPPQARPAAGGAVGRSKGNGQSHSERARKARLNGQLEKARDEFEQSLKVEGFNEAVASDYVAVLVQMGEVDEALRLVQSYEGKLSGSKAINLKISIFEKKKEYRTLSALYDSAFRDATSVMSKNHNLVRLVDAFIRQGEYARALQTCQRWETFYNQNRFGPEADKLRKAQPRIDRSKALCLYFQGQEEQARLIATQLIRTNPEDAIALGILDGTLDKSRFSPAKARSESAATGSGEGALGGVDPLFDWEDIPEDQEIPGSDFSRLVRQMIKQIDLSANLKSVNISGGRYTGSAKELLHDVDILLRRSTMSAKAKAEALFSACKLLEQLELIETTDEARPIVRRKYRLAGRAMAAWGDYMVSQAGQLDTTRMAYCYALKTLTVTKKGGEQAWVDSYNRYIKSFFMAQNGRNSLEEYISEQANKHNRDPANTDILLNGRIPEVLLPEFLVGVLQLVSALDNQSEKQRTFLDELFNRNRELSRALCHQLERFTGRNVPEELDRNGFRDTIRDAAKRLAEKTAELNRLLAELSSVLTREFIPPEKREKLSAERWKPYLTATDISRLTRINYILRRSQEYYQTSEFDGREDCLRAVLLELNGLMVDILREPTDISYDVFLPTLDQMSLKLSEKQLELYQFFAPQISFREAIHPFRTPDGAIQIQITVSNERNYQTADALQIEVVPGGDILYNEGVSTTIQSLRGGEDAEISLRIKISKAADESGSFEATIGYSYKYRSDPEKVELRRMEQRFTFIIHHEDFVALRNPFVTYEEKVMEDDKMFLGRDEQIDQIIDSVMTPDGEPNFGRAVALYGQTRTGKSSFLYHLSKKLTQRYGDKIVICDMENVGDLQISERFMISFMRTLLFTLNSAMNKNEVLARALEDAGLRPPVAQMRKDPDLAGSLFREYLNKLDEIMKREQSIIVLIIDEFTYLHGYIKEGLLPESFMHFWKALLQNHCIMAVVAGQDDMPEFVREYMNDFGSMELMKLNYLPEAAAKRLIREPLERLNGRTGLFQDREGIDEIYRLTAGSAYLTIILCSKLVQYVNEKGAYVITKGIVQEFIRTRALGPNSFLLEKHFEPQIKERGREELTTVNASLLLSVARLSRTTGFARREDIRCPGLSEEEVTRYLDRLVDRNVLIREGRNYWIYVGLLSKWLIDREGA